MTHHAFHMPIGEAQARSLRVNDTVTIEGTLFGIRDANQIALFDKNRATRFDMRGHAAIHTAPNVRRVEPSVQDPTGYAPLCVGTTTSARSPFNRQYSCACRTCRTRGTSSPAATRTSTMGRSPEMPCGHSPG